jgi:DNA-binding response OmpR family regulator
MQIVCIRTKKESTLDAHLRELFPSAVISVCEGALLTKTLIQSSSLVLIDRLFEGEGKDDALLVETLRASNSKVPLFLVCGNACSSSYRELLINAGVDGCVQSPFSWDEFTLKVTKLLQRSNETLFSSTILSSQGVTIDIKDHVVTSDKERIHLTKTEYSILFHLFLNKNRPTSNDHLAHYLSPSIKEKSYALNHHVFNLRKKLGKHSFIKTLSHYGFLLQD